MFLSDIIQDALDDLASTHTSITRKGRALNNLEKLLADICVPSDGEALKFFITLQDTFQCNVPSRLLAWISETTGRLDALTGKGSLDAEREAEVATLASQLMQALSIMQGVALNHHGSKQYLGRRYALEVLLDLFLTSRHVSTMVLMSSTNTSHADRPSKKEDGNVKNTPSPSLASAVLDTLLCILVDSSPALRAFEDTNGVQYVVKILKRAGTPREVRMKCLEFLYFYLLDETAISLGSAAMIDFPSNLQLPTAPSSLVKPSLRSATAASNFSDSSVSSTTSSGSFSTTASYSTYATSVSSCSFSSSSFNGSSTPVEQSPPKSVPGIPGIKPSSRTITPPQPRSLLMLRKEVDFVPISPKKAPAMKLGLGIPRVPSRQRENTAFEDSVYSEAPRSPGALDRTPRKTPSRLGPTKSAPHCLEEPKPDGFKRGHRRAQSSIDIRLPSMPVLPDPRTSGTRTMEEKKEFLGSMLGNVDALVEGVRKAGIWGLG